MSGDKKSSNVESPVYKKWWFWVIIAVVVIAIGGGVSSSKNSPQKVGEGESSTTDGDMENAENKTFMVGDIIAVEGAEVKVESVKRNWSAEYAHPKDGKEYVEVNIQISNKSDDKMSYNSYDWKMEDGSGAIESAAIVIGDDDALNSGELAKGGTKKGSIVFEVPKDDKTLKLHYSPNIFTDKNETIIEL